MQITFTFNNRSLTARLYDNPSARELYAMLPLDLTIEDYSTNEKIAYLPQNLTDADSEVFGDEAVYDLCYYKPWGNLVLYYDRYRYARGLIRLGRLETGVEALAIRGKYPLRIERA